MVLQTYPAWLEQAFCPAPEPHTLPNYEEVRRNMRFNVSEDQIKQDAYHWVPHWRCNSQILKVKNIMRKVYSNGIRYAKDPTYLEVRAQQQGWECGYLSLALLWLVCHKYEEKDISKAQFDLPKIPSWMYALLHEGKSEEPPTVKTST
eukprot:g12742.t1